MEKHRCKLCSKSFSNGRALGGHMKSHLVTSQPTRKKLGESQHELSASSSSSSLGDPDGKLPSYKLRENPRKSFRVADPGFSFANLDSGSSSVVVAVARDDVEESETESETGNPVRKRVRKLGGETRRQRSKKKKKKTTTKTGRNSEEPKKRNKEAGLHSNGSTNESPEPASSISDASPEEDLAMCLIMLSRDARKREMKLKKPVSEKPEEAEKEEEEGEEMKSEKGQSSELRRCLIDLNLPPPADDDEACSVVSAV